MASSRYDWNEDLRQASDLFHESWGGEGMGRAGKWRVSASTL